MKNWSFFISTLQHNKVELKLILLIFAFIGIGHWAQSATFTVTTLAGDNSVGSIRWACDQANATPGHDLVVFDPALGNQPVINMNTNLFITESIEIQGNTALGGQVQLVGGNGDCITMNTNNRGTAPTESVFRNLTIRGFANQAIFIENTENIRILECIIGALGEPNQVGVFMTNCANIVIGTAAENNIFSNNTNEALLLTNSQNITITNYEAYGISKGIDLLQASNVRISDVAIGNARFEGIHIKLSADAQVINSIVGLLPDGTTVATNGGDGIKVEGSTDVLIGGVGDMLRNTIANSKNGVWIGGGDLPSVPREVSNRVTVIGNYIGTDVMGTLSRPNNDHQVRIDDAQNVTLGGPTEDEGNVIGGSPNFYGVHIQSEGFWSPLGLSNILIQNNKIGTDVTGNNALPNESGILIADPQVSNFGPVRVIDNIISGNTLHGIEILNSSVANIIQGNQIGVSSNGTALPNGQNGIQITMTNNNQIGGLAANQGNNISNNNGDGIQIEMTSSNNQIQGNILHENTNGIFINDAPSINNTISQNSTSCNSAKGINLNGTPAVGIGNNRKVTPIITSSSSVGNLYGTAQPGDLIEVFERGLCQTNGTCSADNYQMQGNTYLGSTTASATGEWSFNTPLAPENYTVSATSGSGSTSEFAICACTDPTFTISKTDPTSCDGTDGTIILSPSGLTPLDPLATYDLTFNSPALNGPTSITTDASGVYTITGLAEGNYTNITLTTFNCQTIGGNETLIEPTPPVISTESTDPIACDGSDGGITILGLEPNTSYAVDYDRDAVPEPTTSLTSSGTGTIQINGIIPGNYTNIRVTINGCVSNLESENLVGPSTPVITTSSTNLSSCSAIDGTLTIDGLTANTAGYVVNYLFNGVPAPALTRTSTPTGTIELTSLNAGVYTDITVTLGTCTSNLETESLTSPDPVTINTTSTNPSTCGVADGQITINGLDASTGYQLDYIAGGAPVSIAIASNAGGSYVLNGLSSILYSSITVTNSGCISNAEEEQLIDPDAPNITTTSNSPSVCNGNDGNITISGLTNNTVYQLSYLLNNQTVGSQTITADPTGNYVINTLSEGDYTGIVVNLLGCNSNASSETLSDPLAPTFSVNPSNPTDCVSDNGQLLLTPSGTNPIAPNVTYEVQYVSNGTLLPLNLTANNAGQIGLSNLTEGVYSDVSVSINGCETTDLGTFNLSEPTINGGNATLSSAQICFDEEASLDLISSGGNRIVWQDSTTGGFWTSFSDTLPLAQSLNIINRPSSTGPYHFRALVFRDGCEAISTPITLSVDTCLALFVPEGISVNNDGKNDTWVITGLEDYEFYTIKVFNRWGNVVYESNAPYEPWDGTRNGQELPVATYYWHIEIPETNEKFAGPLTIMR